MMEGVGGVGAGAGEEAGAGAGGATTAADGAGGAASALVSPCTRTRLSTSFTRL